MEWQPIETYDALKKKPDHAVFWFEEVEHERKYASLPATARTERDMGRRVCTHWFKFDPPVTP